MQDFVQYLFREVKSRRLSKKDAIAFIRLYQEGRGGHSILHPLLQRNSSDFAEQRFSSTLHGAEFFLADHVVQGRRVLPGVAYLEMAREAVVRACGLEGEAVHSLRIRNIVWSRPIVVQEAPVEVHIRLYPQPDGAIDFEIYVRSEQEGDEPGVHCRGVAELSQALPETIDIAALQETCVRESLTADAFYEIYRSKSLALGPGLRAVQELFIGDRAALARLVMPASAAGDRRYVLHPSMTDATVTASVGLRVKGGEVQGNLALPFALEDMQVLGRCSERMWAVARFSAGSQATDVVQKFDLDLCDGNGRVCVRMRGFSTRVLGGELGAEGMRPARKTEVAAGTIEPPAGPADDPLLDKIKRMLVQTASRQLKLSATKINSDAELSGYGFDSLMLSDFVNTLNQNYQLGLAPTVFFEHSTLNAFARYLSEQHRDALAVRLNVQARPSPGSSTPMPDLQAASAKGRPRRSRFAAPAITAASAQKDDDPVAIIGMSGVFPMAENVDEFWANLVSGRDCMREIPSDRWDWRDYYGDPTKEANKTNIKWGGFIDGVAHFDPLFFGISPKEAEMMDPQQRLLMLHVWNAIEDAGYAPASLAGSNTAIFAGTASTGYSRLVFRAQMAIEGYMNTGAAPSVGPNRMSYFLDWHGPSEPVETACSSALVAIRRGVQAIEGGECGMAIVGGVNTIVNPDAHISFSKAGMLCEDGRCKTFSDKANGYARGEGAAMLALKRLSAAERDGDHIYAVIRGAAENHGGRANSLTAPNPKAQAELIKTAFRQAGVDPRTVGYIEAHGTGTSLGDPVEINGLKSAFRDLYAAAGALEVKEAHCGVGSVKTNIGHLEMAAGAAGVIKVLLQMRHKTLAPSLHCETINPYIDLEGSPFYIVREKRDWPAPTDEAGGSLPRRAGVSSFGFGGVNAHVVLEEYVPLNTAPMSIVVSEERPALILLSARNEERLQDRVRQLLEAIRRGVVTPETLVDAAYTLQVGREAMEARLALAVSSVDDLAAKLEAVALGETAVDDVYRGDVKKHKHDLALFTADEDAAQMLAAWLAKGKYGKLLELWAKGLNFDWSRLYGDARPRRISLPTYPFAKERCWVPDVGAKPLVEGAARQAGAEHLHPLVHRNSSTLAEQRFSTTFSGAEFVLADHVLRGVRLLPGVAQLEMARAALAQALEIDGAGENANGLHLRNIVFSRPVEVGEAGLEVHVGVRPAENGDLAYELYGWDSARNERLSYSQGLATLAQAPEARIDLAAVQSACRREQLSAEDFYGAYREKGLVLGPRLRAIQKLYIGEDRVLARLAMPAEVIGDRARYLLHPSMLDAAVTVPAGLLLHSGAAASGLALPFALQALEILGECRETMWALARPSAGGGVTGKALKFDLDLCDDDGRVCVRFVGLSVRASHGVSGALGASSAPETLLLAPEWRPEQAPQGHASSYEDRAALLCGVPVDAAALAELVGCRCETAPADYIAQTEMVLVELQTRLKAGLKGPALLQIVVPAFGPHQVSAGLAGLLKSARLENPKLIGQVICVEGDQDAEGLAAKLRENGGRPQDGEVRYLGGARHVLGWREVHAEETLIPWRAGGTYLITGGLGGLGRIFAADIARRAPGARLVLTGRRELDEAGRLLLRELEALGAEASYRAVDVADCEAVRRLVLEVQEAHEGLNGIIHSAGIIRDSLLSNKSAGSLRQVLAPKVAGVVHLDEASRDLELEWFICFSSLTAVKGNVGQADYAAGNAFMDAFAAYRNSLVALGERRGLTVSVNWPLWAEGGMRVDAGIERAMKEATGMAPIPTRDGVEALYRALASWCGQVAVMWGDAARMRRTLVEPPAPQTAPTASVGVPMAAAATADAGDTLADQIKRLLIGVVSDQAKLRPEKVRGDSELHEYGFDSIMLADLGSRLNREYEIDLAPTVFFEFPTLNDLANYLSRRYAAKFSARLGLGEASKPADPAVAPASTKAAPPMLARSRLALAPGRVAPGAKPDAVEPIAIIGLSGRFPQAGDLDALWENLQAGRDCVTEAPATRWNMAEYYDPQKGRPGKSYTRWGGFIDGVEEFDALFFNISPREAQALDPQARLFLQTVWSLLESAGHTRESLRAQYHGRVGVYVGAMAQPIEGAANGEAAIASLSASSAIANRISYFFDLEGPSIAVDTMCSSAMMAIHLACRDLQQGECALAVAGGVNLSLSPQKFVSLCQLQLAGSHPASRAFTDGDGHLPAETVGAALLKPLRQAIADEDPILAVIKGTATHHSGRSNGYAAPNPKAQAKVIRESLRRAGVSPESISYVEAAAAGSALGDAVEVAALTSVFGEASHNGRRWPVGAVKSNLGHPELASGMAQIAKVTLQMRYRRLAPLVAIGAPNPQLRLDETPFELQRELTDWGPSIGPDGERQPRRALINSFAAGGAYVSAVLEEYLPPDQPGDGNEPPEAQTPQAHVFVFSAQNDERLSAVVDQALRRLESGEAVVLRDLAYTLQVGREAMDSRLAVIAATRTELCELLRAYLDGADTAGMPLYRNSCDVAAPEAAAGDLDALARRWAQGGAVLWAQLYPGRRPRRIIWPTYPFARTVYPINYAGAHPSTREPALEKRVSAPSHEGAEGIEALVVGALAESLGVPSAQLPLHKPLRTLGFNSIAATELKYRLEAALQRTISLELIGDGRRSTAELALLLADAVSDAETATAATPKLTPQPEARLQPFPLTDMQESFLIGRRTTIDGDRIGAHVYLEIDVGETLDIFRLNRAWARLVAQHDMLRAVMVDGGQQKILPAVRDYRFKVIDIRRLGEAERRLKAEALRQSMEAHIFSGEEWPLFDIRVSIHGQRHYRIHFSIDELIVDGLSIDMLLRQWGQLYADPGRELPEQEVSFRDYVLAMKAFEDTPRFSQDLAYWGERLASMPGGPAFPRPSDKDGSRGARRRVRLNHRLAAPAWEALKARATAIQASPTSLVLSVFAETLRAWTASRSFTLVLTYFNRPPMHPQIRELIGPAISSLLFVVEPRQSDDLETIVKGNHRRLWQDLDHASVSGVRALRQLRGRRSGGAPMTLPVVFTSMLGSDVTGDRLEYLGEIVHALNQTPQVCLDHQLRESDRGLDCSWDVAEGWFEPGYVDAMFEAYCGVLEGLASGRLAWTVDSFARSPAAETAPTDQATALLAQFMADAQREDAHGAFALTDQQQAYAFGRDAGPEGGVGCQVYQELKVVDLDAPRLEQALAALIERHPMLRAMVDAQGRQSVLTTAPRYAIEVTDLRRLTVEQREAALAATRHALLGRVVRPGEWPYFTVMASLLDDRSACVHLCFDMLIADSPSIGLMLQELITLYERPAALSPVPAVTFRAYQQAVDRFRATPGHAERVGYWKRRFESLPAGPALPKLPGNGAAAAVGHQRISGVLDKWSALRDCAKARGLEPGMILLTAYLEVLYAWNDQQPLAVVVPGWERLPAHPDMDRVVGDFTALTWAARWPEAMSFELRLQQVCRQHADDLAQRPVSGLQALRRLLLKEGRRQSRYPVVFTNHISRQELPGRNFELGRSISRTPQVCLDNISSEVGCRLHCNWDFDGEIYAEDMIAEMFDGYLRLLELLASNEQAWRRIDFGNLIRARPSAYTTNESRGVSCRGSGWNACATKTGERKSLEGRRTLS